ncbi:uncharacterized protein LOC133891203 [Phragmites australis]|uniref:uncharacterized protein LOC133891203 n=1 Tax=Phragmites australis TaxID=29695 RepID=UPI002D778FE4|nr:uncharacterized protein LOC133891203 [Phragmites australis]
MSLDSVYHIKSRGRSVGLLCSSVFPHQIRAYLLLSSSSPNSAANIGTIVPWLLPEIFASAFSSPISKPAVRSLLLLAAVGDLAAALRRVACSGAIACVAVTGPARAVVGWVRLTDMLCFLCDTPDALAHPAAQGRHWIIYGNG